MADLSISNLMEGASNQNKRLRDETRGLVDKWERTGLLEGLETEYEKSGMAILLENQAKQLIDESSKTGTSSNSEEWSGVALPLVRRVFSEIAAKEMVSVQPMNLPSGLVFYLDFKYGTSKGDFLSGQGKDSQADSVFGITDAASGTAPSEGLYGAGRFGYSINDTAVSLYATKSAFTPNAASASVQQHISEADFNFDSEFSASIADGDKLWKISVSSASLSGLDTEGVRGFLVTGSSAGYVAAVYPALTTISSNDGIVNFIVSASDAGVAAHADIQVIYQKQPTDTSRGDFEDSSDGTGTVTDLDIPQINVEMKSNPIVAKTRKLKAVWTPEFAQDLNAYHSIDAEAELTSMLSEYISQEIDLEILDMLMENAQTVDYWSAKIGYEYDAGTAAFGQSNATAQAYNQGTWFQTLGTKVQKVSNKIHQLTMRGGANFLVCSPTIATIIESIPGYAADTDGNQMQFAMGVQKVGALNNRFTVYKNPYMLENQILVGYRGSQFLETGAVYAPYVPLIMTPLVYDPTNFTPRKGVMTRYAKEMVRPEFYGKIKVHGLDTI